MSHYYYYLHTNGDIIGKPHIVVDSDPSYFDSPFVKHHWRVDITNRADAWTVAIEALALGARLERILELAKKWKLTREDLPEFLTRLPNPSPLQREGMDRFIRDVLELNPETVWAEISEELT